MENFDRFLVPLHISDFTDHEIEGVKVRIILEKYHQRFTRKCLYACSTSKMNLPSVDMIDSKELAVLLLNSTRAKIVNYPTSIELDVTTNKVTASDNETSKIYEYLQWLDTNTGRTVKSINWLQFADYMPFSPNPLDTIVLAPFADRQNYSYQNPARTVFVDNSFGQLKALELQISSNTCQWLRKPMFSCFYDSTSYNAEILARQLDQISNRQCSLRVFCKNDQNESYRRKHEN